MVNTFKQTFTHCFVNVNCSSNDFIGKIIDVFLSNNLFIYRTFYVQNEVSI